MPFNKPADEAKYEDLEKVIVGNDPEKFFQVGAQLPPQEREQLVEFLKKNVDVFAWSVYEASRVCVDFTDLNKACPKDPFPMPRIDRLVDATVGHSRMSFLDAFQGYYQIPLALDDQEKTTLVTPTGNYH